jgi:uncharacterized protein YjbI with pentapeptide repeats
LEEELDRQALAKGRQMLVKRETRFDIMAQLAIEMFLSDKVELTGNEIRLLSARFLSPEQQQEMEEHQREILTCSFLIREADKYRFSHQSFMEFLVACHLAKDIAADDSKHLSAKVLNWTTLGFLRELAQSDQSAKPDFNNPNLTYYDHHILQRWFSDGPKLPILAANIISVLVACLPTNEFISLPLHEADLHGANLSRVDLSRAILKGANLSEVDLSRADLSHADLSEVCLKGSDLRGIDLSEADLSAADLRGANLRGADLSGADLSRADLSRADLSRADLVGADLRGADLSRADLNRVTWGKVASKGTTLQQAAKANLTLCENMKLHEAKNLDEAILAELLERGAINSA